MVSVSISRSRMWLRLSVPQTTVSTPRVWSSSRFLGLEPGHGAVYAELPLGDLAGHEVVFVRAGHSHKASQLATSAVRRVSTLMESPQMTGMSSISASIRHWLSTGSMMTISWRLASSSEPDTGPHARRRQYKLHNTTSLYEWYRLFGERTEHGLLGEDGGADGVQFVGLVVEHLQVGVGDAADDLFALKEALGESARPSG